MAGDGGCVGGSEDASESETVSVPALTNRPLTPRTRFSACLCRDSCKYLPRGAEGCRTSRLSRSQRRRTMASYLWTSRGVRNVRYCCMGCGVPLKTAAHWDGLTFAYFTPSSSTVRWLGRKRIMFCRRESSTSGRLGLTSGDERSSEESLSSSWMSRSPVYSIVAGRAVCHAAFGRAVGRCGSKDV